MTKFHRIKPYQEKTELQHAVLIVPWHMHIVTLETWVKENWNTNAQKNTNIFYFYLLFFFFLFQITAFLHLRISTQKSNMFSCENLHSFFLPFYSNWPIIQWTTLHPDTPQTVSPHLQLWGMIIPARQTSLVFKKQKQNPNNKSGRENVNT